MSSVLLVGESSIATTVHTVGVDQFTMSHGTDDGALLRHALTEFGHTVNWIPAYQVQDTFPLTTEALSDIDVLLLSDIGANTLALHPAAYLRGRPTPNRLSVIADWTRAGGGLAMCGGYLSFAGIRGTAAYYGSPVENVLPVTIAAHDDRVETPDGTRPDLIDPAHPVVAGLGQEWPSLLGYNRVRARPEATVLATLNSDPLLTVSAAGKGRTLAWTSDIGPHWCPTEFTDWTGFRTLWGQAVTWLTEST